MAALQQDARLQAAFTDLPPELQSLVFAYAGAPTNTCKASRDVFKDPHLTVTWLLATTSNSIEDALQRALGLRLWDACIPILDLKEHWDPVTLQFALIRAAGSGHLQLLQALLGKGGWAEWLWSADHPHVSSTEHWEWMEQRWEEHKPMYPEFSDFKRLCYQSHPLTSAARKGHMHTCTFLLQHRAISTAAKHQALVAAAGAGHLPVVQLLYENDVGVRKPDLGDSALCAAAAGGHVEEARFLLDQGASPYNFKGTLWAGKSGGSGWPSYSGKPSYCSPLAVAAAAGHTEILQLLHDRGVTYSLHHWHKALLEAIRAHKLCSIIWLLAEAALQQELQALLSFHKELPNSWDADKSDPFCVAVRSLRGTEVLQVLLMIGRDAVNKESALAEAAACGSVPHMQLLLHHGANVDGEAGSSHYRTPLARAIQHGSVPAVKLLLEAGAQAGSRALAMPLQWCPFHTCLGYSDRHQQVFEMLLAHGVIDDEGHALFKAAERGLWQLVPTLLELGSPADASQQQQQHINEGNASKLGSRVALALCVASQNGRLWMVEHLLNYKGPGNSNINASAEGRSEHTGVSGLATLTEAEGSKPEPGCQQASNSHQGVVSCSTTSLLSQADLDRALLAAIGAELTGYWEHLQRPQSVCPTIGHRRIMKLLIQHGADVNADEGAALFTAVVKEDRSAVKLLLRRGADPQLRQASEALYRALSNVDWWTAKQLLEHGAKPTAEELQLIEEVESYSWGRPELAAYGSDEDKSEEEEDVRCDHRGIWGRPHG
jgi:ankyrin repeat protein